MDRLPGWDNHSYGYHGDDGCAFKGSGKGNAYGPTFSTGAPALGPGPHSCRPAPQTASLAPDTSAAAAAARASARAAHAPHALQRRRRGAQAT